MPRRRKQRRKSATPPDDVGQVRDAEFTVLDDDAVGEPVDAIPMDAPKLPRGLLSGPRSKATPARVQQARQHAFTIGVVGVGAVAGIAALAGLAKLLGRRR